MVRLARYPAKISKTMSSTPEDSETSATSDEQSGLSYGPLVIFLSATVIVGSGLLVYTMEQANLPLVSDLVWIIGYGLAVGSIWIIWLRPVDFAGPADRKTVDRSQREEPGADSSERNGPEWAISGWTESEEMPIERGTEENTDTSETTTSGKETE